MYSNNICSIISEDGVFSIDLGTGKIIVLDIMKLDYESVMLIVLKVEMIDGVNKDIVDIIFNLINVNDSDMVFIKESEMFNYVEGMVVGVMLGKVIVIDVDGDSISYSIV